MKTKLLKKVRKQFAIVEIRSLSPDNYSSEAETIRELNYKLPCYVVYDYLYITTAFTYQNKKEAYDFAAQKIKARFINKVKKIGKDTTIKKRIF